MTMLDRMRRHQGWLKWSLGLVVLTFVFFYVPDFLSPPAGAGATSDAVATVQGRPITVSDFTRAYNAQMAQFRNAYGGNMSPAMLRQLGMDRQVLQQMIDQEAVLAEATRLGISATDAEVRERIVSIPAFQENGQFIGEQRYRQLLRLQRPPITAAQFEDEIRNSVILDKMRATLTEWITVSETEADAEYRRRNEKVSLELVSFPTVSFLDQVQVTDAEVAGYFEQGKETYRIGERRKVRYLLLDGQAIRNNITVPEQDIQRAYRQNIDQYCEIRAGPGQPHPAEHRRQGRSGRATKAEDLLKQIKGGADFATLAKANSQESASASKGGESRLLRQGPDGAGLAEVIKEIAALLALTGSSELALASAAKSAPLNLLEQEYLGLRAHRLFVLALGVHRYGARGPLGLRVLLNNSSRYARWMSCSGTVMLLPESPGRPAAGSFRRSPNAVRLLALVEPAGHLGVRHLIEGTTRTGTRASSSVTFSLRRRYSASASASE